MLKGYFSSKHVGLLKLIILESVPTHKSDTKVAMKAFFFFHEQTVTNEKGPFKRWELKD